MISVTLDAFCVDFWQFLLRSRTIPAKRRVRRFWSSLLGGSSCLMMMPICTGSISVDSLVPLAPCSPISVVRLRFAAWPDGGGIFMVAIPVAKWAEPSNLRATPSWAQSTSWSMIPVCWSTGISQPSGTAALSRPFRASSHQLASSRLSRVETRRS